MMRRVVQRGILAPVASRSYTDARTIRKPNPYDQILNSTNQEYVENLLAHYTEDQSLVDRSWAPVLNAISSNDMERPVVSTFSRPTSDRSVSEQQRLDNMRLTWMVREYERNGHHLADVDPVKGHHKNSQVVDPAVLDHKSFGFSDASLSNVFHVTFGSSFESTFVSSGEAMTLQQIMDQLRKMYCGRIGFEYMSCGYFELRNWFRQEVVNYLTPLTKEEKLNTYMDVVKACGLEKFLQVKYSTQQRFGLDGGEALIPLMNAALNVSSDLGVQKFYLGMAHRGRLNVLANVCGKSLHAILNEFEGRTAVANAHLSGDVKYHLGLQKACKLANGKTVEVDLLPNPSHLEAVNPLVLGKSRARQTHTKDLELSETLPILIHGDAAFAGQGPCYEAMGLSDLESFDVGGTLHIVINNQIGFTTNPEDSRAGSYCTDLSKMNNAPVLHVNGDDVEACVRAAQLASRFRQQFHRDIIIDLVCYRRNGHNEADLPDFTQPHLYKHIRQHPRLIDIYSKQLVAEKVISAEDVKTKDKEWDNVMREAFERMNSSQDFVKVTNPPFDPESENTSSDLAGDRFASITRARSSPPVNTGVPLEKLREVGRHLNTIPPQMEKAHPVVERSYAARKKGMEDDQGVEWCAAELLAFGTLSLEGIPVRLTGEDVERGTFTQRHAGITDQKTNLKYFPVKTIDPAKQALITISNSSLSEMAVCGFEMGYNLENPKMLSMWEAQFGDFANGAQVIFDQFLNCSEEKWNEPSSLVLSLPHGYSGAGPEHSSARVERFLQLSDDLDKVPRSFRKMPNETAIETRIRRHNWQVCYPSTPANYFHLLRRQALRDFAKPLIIFFSKARLRAPNLSPLTDMSVGTAFKPVIDTSEKTAPEVVARKIVFCSGQIESIVADARAAMQKTDKGVHNDVVLITVEQLAPFPWEQVADALEKHLARNPNAEIVWLQEEPKNMGMWAHLRPRFRRLLKHLGVQQTNIKCIARPSVASPSTGYGSVHVEEEKKLISEVLA